MQNTKLNGTFEHGGRTFTMAAVYPFMNKAVVVEGDLETGAIFEFAYKVASPYSFNVQTAELAIADDIQLVPAVWNDWSIQNRPGYQIDGSYLHRVGKVKAIDNTNYPCTLNVQIAKNGIVFAK